MSPTHDTDPDRNTHAWGNTQHIVGFPAGEPLEITCEVTDDDDTPLDITGVGNIEWLVKHDETAPDAAAFCTKALYSLTTHDAGEIELTAPERGEFTIYVDGDETADIPGCHFHKATITDENGRDSRLFSGTVALED